MLVKLAVTMQGISLRSSEVLNEETSSARLAFLVDPFGGLFKSTVRVRTISVDTDQLAARKRGDRAV